MAEETSMIFQQASQTTSYLLSGLPKALHRPRLAIICGSGLGGLAETVERESSTEFDYASIPHFPKSAVQGHAGKLVFGFIGPNIPTVLMVGRSHFYEGHPIDKITFPIRVFKLLGIEIVIVTNAAGGLNPDYAVGDIVILNDHLFLAGLAGLHPLRGPNAGEFGVRFPALSDAYDLELRRVAHQAWTKIQTSRTKRKIHEGVYAFVGGPSYETRAECRMLRQLGGDLVGMSTVPEVIVARHCGIRVLALSVVTNSAVLTAGPQGDDALLVGANGDALNAIIQAGKANHEEVLDQGRQAAVDFQTLVSQTVEALFAVVR